MEIGLASVAAPSGPGPEGSNSGLACLDGSITMCLKFLKLQLRTFCGSYFFIGWAQDFSFSNRFAGKHLLEKVATSFEIP